MQELVAVGVVGRQEPAAAGWNDLIDRLGEVSGVDTGSYAGWLAAMENRRAFFKANGAVSTDPAGAA